MKMTQFYSEHQKDFIITKHKNFPLSLSGVGLTHYHNTYELFYLIFGDRYYFINNKCYHITAGNLVFIKKYDIHYTAPYENKEYERYVINFKKEFIENIVGQLNTPLYKFFDNDVQVIEFSGREREQVEYLFSSMYEQYDYDSDEYPDFIRTSLVQLLMIINNQQSYKSTENIEYINHTHQLITEISGYINNNFSQDLSLESISKKFYISNYYFSRTFKKTMGISFVDYLNNVRIKEAQFMLVNSSENVTAISKRVGFKNATHFGRVFKEITGYSPLSYRKSFLKQKKR